MKRTETTGAASGVLGYSLVFVGFVLLILSLAVGNVLMAERVLANVGLSPLAQNSSLILWGGLAAIIIGAFIVVTSGVDVDVE
jgi:hypothetical protein